MATGDQQSFDLNPGTSQLIDIAVMPENAETPRVWFYYAQPGEGKSERNLGVPLERFPHRLTVEVSAENIFVPVIAAYELSIDSLGRLRMVEVKHR